MSLPVGLSPNVSASCFGADDGVARAGCSALCVFGTLDMHLTGLILLRKWFIACCYAIAIKWSSYLELAQFVIMRGCHSVKKLEI